MAVFCPYKKGLALPPVCSQVSCPYSEMNLNKEGLLPDRLGGERPLVLSGPPARGRRPDQHPNNPTQTTSALAQSEPPLDPQSRSAPENNVLTRNKSNSLKKLSKSQWW